MRNRREFLELSLRAAALAGLAGAGLGMERTGDPRAASAGGGPASELDGYNYAVGTQTIGASYQFTDKPRLMETADAIRRMGSSVIKFNLGEARQRAASTGANRTLRDDATNDPAVRQVFHMPFGHYLLWAYSASPDSDPPASQPPRDQELYDL